SDPERPRPLRDRPGHGRRRDPQAPGIIRPLDVECAPAGVSAMKALDRPEAIEHASRSGLLSLQLDRLKCSLSRAYANVAHYQAAFDTAGAHPNDLQALADLARFPFTAKEDLRRNYPFGMFAAPMAAILRIHSSSGTTGSP